MDIIEVTKELLKSNRLCDNCLGRQFALLGYRLDNNTRGQAIKTVLFLQLHERSTFESAAENIEDLKKLGEFGNFLPAFELLKKLGHHIDIIPEPCSICGGLFESVEKFAQNALRKLEGIEFKTFLLGNKSLDEIIEKEDEMKATYKLKHGESIKGELNREVGKSLKQLLPPDKEPDFDHPNVLILVDVKSRDVEVHLNPLFLSGKYCKYSRSIPQTKWLCRDCRGKGCEHCGGTGKRYQISVSELIGNVILEKTEGIDFKFHGAGREDIDARMLGDGREFVLEVKEPKIRFLDLEKLEQEINQRADELIEVKDLKPTDRDRIQRIKIQSPLAKKRYRAIIELGDPIDPEKLQELESYFQNVTIKQLTPLRVLHRRVDKTRSKLVHSVKAHLITDTSIELEILAQGGTYIKELISGDTGRSTPSIAEFLQTTAVVKTLDVLEVETK